MIKALLRKVGVIAPVDPGVRVGHPRDPRWSSVRAIHLARNPVCMACGSNDSLNVHHCLPYHLYPELELDKHNLITLCESNSHNCHLTFGHGLDWKAYNHNVREDSAHIRAMIAGRLYKAA